MSGAATAGTGTRTRSIWLWQLVLAASVVVITLVVMALAPEVLAPLTMQIGIGMVLAMTVVVMIAPWDRVRKSVVALVPLTQIIAIGSLAWGTDLRFDFLWVFPLAWLATHYRTVWMMIGLILVATIIVIDAVTNAPTVTSTIRFSIVLMSLAFLSITIHIGARKTGAFNRLLRRQSARLESTVARVRTQERRTGQMLSSLDAGIVRVDREGHLLIANDAYVRLYGLDPRDLAQPGSSVEYDGHAGTALREADRPRVRAARGEIFTGERLWLFDAQGQWHTLTASTIELARGPAEPETTMLIVSDITAEVEAERANRTLSATVTHELANPLTAVLGYTDLLLDDDLTDQQRERLELIDAAGRRMQHLITEVLSAGGPPRPAEAPRRLTDVRAVLVASVESFAPSAAAGEVALTVVDGPPVWVVADAFRLRQVFDNIVSNAVKYTAPSGSVEVSAGPNGTDAVVTVRDTGIGIGADDLALVFTDYFRAAEAWDSGTPGTGLGMGISRSIVEQHGGVIALGSEPGVGTTVTVRLPLAAGAVPHDTAAIPTVPARALVPDTAAPDEVAP